MDGVDVNPAAGDAAIEVVARPSGVQEQNGLSLVRNEIAGVQPLDLDLDLDSDSSCCVDQSHLAMCHGDRVAAQH